MSARMERLFWMAATCGAVYLCFIYLQAHAYQTRSTRVASYAIAQSGLTSSVMGKIEIPELNLSAAILQNYDPDSLRKGVGHIPNTAMPGGLGTVGLAGHRDTFFRPLQRISPHAEIRLLVPGGIYHYIVDSTEIVTPDRVDVLETGMRPELILITCFPFDYIGAAPKRFIVHAHLLSASPDPNPPNTSEESHEALPN
jgi:sortase A